MEKREIIYILITIGVILIIFYYILKNEYENYKKSEKKNKKIPSYYLKTYNTVLVVVLIYISYKILVTSDIGSNLDKLSKLKRPIIMFVLAIAFMSLLWLILYTFSNRCVNDKKITVLSAPNVHEFDNNKNLDELTFITAYNCCCTNFGKDRMYPFIPDMYSIHTCALKHCLLSGVRSLDFEIYQKNLEPLIGISINSKENRNNNTYHGVFHNGIKFEEAIKLIKTHAFNYSKIGIGSKLPVIIHLRIHSYHNTVLNKIADIICKHLGDRLIFNSDDNKCHSIDRLLQSEENDYKTKNSVKNARSDYIEKINLGRDPKFPYNMMDQVSSMSEQTCTPELEIKTESECKTAAKRLNIPYYDETDKNKSIKNYFAINGDAKNEPYPSNCWYHSGFHKKVYFNHNKQKEPSEIWKNKWDNNLGFKQIRKICKTEMSWNSKPIVKDYSEISIEDAKEKVVIVIGKHVITNINVSSGLDYENGKKIMFSKLHKISSGYIHNVRYKSNYYEGKFNTTTPSSISRYNVMITPPYMKGGQANNGPIKTHIIDCLDKKIHFLAYNFYNREDEINKLLLYNHNGKFIKTKTKTFNISKINNRRNSVLYGEGQSSTNIISSVYNAPNSQTEYGTLLYSI